MPMPTITSAWRVRDSARWLVLRECFTASAAASRLRRSVTTASTTSAAAPSADITPSSGCISEITPR